MIAKEFLIQSVQDLLPSADPNSAKGALQFFDLLPRDVPMPTVVLLPSRRIGLVMCTEGGEAYFDAEFPDGDSISFFFRCGVYEMDLSSIPLTDEMTLDCLFHLLREAKICAKIKEIL